MIKIKGLGVKGKTNRRKVTVQHTNHIAGQCQFVVATQKQGRERFILSCNHDPVGWLKLAGYGLTMLVCKDHAKRRGAKLTPIGERDLYLQFFKRPSDEGEKE